MGWAEELTSETTPNEVNRTFKVKFDKESFIGKEALLKQKEEGVTKRLIQFHLEEFDKDSDIWPWAGESIYRDAGQGEAQSSWAASPPPPSGSPCRRCWPLGS